MRYIDRQRRARSRANGRLRFGLTVLVLGLSAGPLAAAPAEPVVREKPTVPARKGVTEPCLECHEGEGEEVSFPDGSKISTGIDVAAWGRSVHSRKLGCTDCHRQLGEHPHPQRRDASARAYRLAQSQGCKRCHYAYYTRVLDGIHYAELKKGSAKAPSCVDCHGAHDTLDPRRPRLAISERCAGCHAKVARAYGRSVHGRALREGNLQAQQDVPVCTDCHGAHAIADPRRAEFRLTSHLLCAECHSDEKRMKRYRLSSAVTTTYLDDFHGRSTALYARGAGAPTQAMATCIDCHGAHDIARFDRQGTASAVRERVVVLCRRCHKTATPAFAAAWLSHYPPTLARAPLVWGVKWGYRILIPLIMSALVLHILLHLWRVRSGR
ncbi:MAG: cytochrome c3 family protein [Deltaproteobacteria bacterium]|nr:cytochrome c3 family protein [Deltaproteobacteria bacterium]